MAKITTKSNNTGRPQTRTVNKGILQQSWGSVRKYFGVTTGGSAMKALLGPDIGDAQRTFDRGTPTASGKSLHGVMPGLNQASHIIWKAGHLLNADFGGDGTADKNLTALSAQANKNHSTFEGHVKTMLGKCHAIDQNDPGHAFWYGVEYEVRVSSAPFAQYPAQNDWHSYVCSHIDIEYRFVTIDKTNDSPGIVNSSDKYYAVLSKVQKPTYTIGTHLVVSNFGVVSFGPIRIYNQ